MSEPSVVHDTLVLERTYDASPARVFKAWADPAARGRWDVPGEGWEVAAFESDFRVGGREFSRFGTEGRPRATGVKGVISTSFRTGASSPRAPCTTGTRVPPSR